MEADSTPRDLKLNSWAGTSIPIHHNTEAYSWCCPCGSFSTSFDAGNRSNLIEEQFSLLMAASGVCLNILE